MLKKILASAAFAGLLASQSVAAVAAPTANAPQRTSSAVAGSENIGGMSEVWLVALFALLAAGIIVLVEEEEDDSGELPDSP